MPQEHILNGDAAVRAEHPDDKQMANRAALSSIAGSALEWLDFAAYGAIAATVLPQLFFSATDTTTAALAAFATFSVGFVARPLGGLICGDRDGNFLLIETGEKYADCRLSGRDAIEPEAP